MSTALGPAQVRRSPVSQLEPGRRPQPCGQAGVLGEGSNPYNRLQASPTRKEMQPAGLVGLSHVIDYNTADTCRCVNYKCNFDLP